MNPYGAMYQQKSASLLHHLVWWEWFTNNLIICGCAQFDNLWMCIHFSHQPPACPLDMSSEQYHWRLVDDFINNFNKHWAQNYFLSNEICVNESMSEWYGQGSHLINHGYPCMLPSTGSPIMYVKSRMWLVDVVEC